MAEQSSKRALGARQAAILSAIVREYIRSGEPVGSKSLVGRFRLDVSSATVRNDMSLLEELGYLAQPHTSAGRIPTDLGYRWFVDTLGPPKLTQSQERELTDALGEPADLDSKLSLASDVLSHFTSYAAAVLTPRLQVSHLRHLDLAWLGPRLVVAVVIGDGGRVEKRMFELEADVSEADVEHLAHEVNRQLGGLSLDEASQKLMAMAKRAPAKDRGLLAGVGAALALMVAAEQRVFVGGASTLAADETLSSERDKLRKVYEAIERGTDVLRLFEEAIRPVSVRIGSELPVEELHSLSVVAAPYGAEVEGGGTVGVIGPTRMDYLRAMAIVAAVARTLESSLRELDR
ncbi:MAG: heat-inducible transcriptional repressor HrcA [Actinomycetota bacterium]